MNFSVGSIGRKNGILTDFPLSSACLSYLKSKSLAASMRVFKSHLIEFYSLPFIEPMIRAARFTISPSTENSFLLPDVPVIPEKHSPDETPMLQ